MSPSPLTLQREVAFKVLDRKYAQDREAIERFRREAKNAASLRHPNIVATHDRGETEDGTYYIVMEYLEGGTLEDLIEEAGPLPPREAAEIAVEIADALQLVHESGVIHRDIKPQNILLSKDGEAKVADFGIARAASATTMTQAGSILGTVHYIAPEQALGDPATPQSDLYSLGVVLYEMLTGELPYDAESPVGVVMGHVGGLVRSPKDANPEVPEELGAVVLRLLSRDTEELLDTSKPEPVIVGGQKGVLLDASVSPRLKDYSAACGSVPCAFLLTRSNETGFALWADQTNRLIVLEDVESETVILAVSAPVEGFTEFAPKAEEVLSTVEIETAGAWFGFGDTELPAGLNPGSC